MGVTMDIEVSLATLAQLFKEDTQKLQETLEGMQSEAAQRGDQQEKQHGEIRNALEEVKQLIISTGGTMAPSINMWRRSITITCGVNT